MRILITNRTLTGLTGSEINCLELANHFLEKGHNVTFCSDNVGEPWLKESSGIPVISKAQFVPHSYDAVWMHHANDFKELDCSKLPIVNYIMSSWLEEEHPAPRAYRYLYVSPEAAEAWHRPGATVLLNMAPKGFFFVPPQLSKIRSIAVVTNHIVPEVHHALRILQEEGYHTMHYGVGGVITRITPTILDSHDTFITIGKTAVYCLAAGKPVYCYDHFGGPGYITPDNYEKAVWHNLSGRCCHTKKSAREIANEIKALPTKEELLALKAIAEVRHTYNTVDRIIG